MKPAGGSGAAGVGGRCAVRNGTEQHSPARHGTASAVAGGFCTAAVTGTGLQRGRALGAAGGPEPAPSGPDREPRGRRVPPLAAVSPNSPVPTRRLLTAPSPLLLFPHHPSRGSPIFISSPQSPPCSLLLKEESPRVLPSLGSSSRLRLGVPGRARLMLPRYPQPQSRGYSAGAGGYRKKFPPRTSPRSIVPGCSRAHSKLRAQPRKE